MNNSFVINEVGYGRVCTLIGKLDTAFLRMQHISQRPEGAQKFDFFKLISFHLWVEFSIFWSKMRYTEFSNKIIERFNFHHLSLT